MHSRIAKGIHLVGFNLDHPFTVHLELSPFQVTQGKGKAPECCL